jgi:uncharacterized protein YdhG (YjbR/CyaY superfamily)
MATTTIDDVLADLPTDRRDALEALRSQIRDAAPDAVESINYGVPAFKVDGRPFVSFGSAKQHLTFYVQSPAVIEAFASALAAFRVSTGSVQFTPDHPIPEELVRRLIAARIAGVRAPKR